MKSYSDFGYVGNSFIVGGITEAEKAVEAHPKENANIDGLDGGGGSGRSVSLFVHHHNILVPFWRCPFFYLPSPCHLLFLGAEITPKYLKRIQLLAPLLK